MRKQLSRRLLSLFLAVALCAGFVFPASVAAFSEEYGLTVEQVDNSAVSAQRSDRTIPEDASEQTAAEPADTDIVRVSIVLSGKSALEVASASGIAATAISSNAATVSYRRELERKQAAMAQKISTQALQGEELDVAWNLTLAANIISANVPYGKIAEIEKVSGVERVFLETVYEPVTAERQETAEPNMSTAASMTGVSYAYANGYTGAGTRIAIIDTGLDTDHEALTPEGLEYSLSLLAEKNGEPAEAYIESLDLLDVEEIAGVLSQLNVAKRGAFTADDLYINTKIPFGFNYIDVNLDVTHDNDSQSSHGSHVGGIAAANAYVPNGDGTFSNALETVLCQGIAPDAQVFAMKIFGKNGGAYESDYMAAIEDAIILGADSINISIGTSAVGLSTVGSAYREIIENLQKSDVYVSISGGNNGAWPEETMSGGYLYGDDVSMATGGSPGSYTFSMTTASVENVGYTDRYITVEDETIFYGASSNDWFAVPLVQIAGDYEYILIDGYGTDADFAAVADVLEGKIAVCSRGGGVTFGTKAANAVKYGAAGTIVYNNEPNSMFYMNLELYFDEEPCVSITQEDGDFMRSVATPVTDESGNVLYYKGSLSIPDAYKAVYYDSDYYTMSDFSSWGVPGSLEMKPEISAPGGNIFSLDGKTAGGSSYEVMSGTSMAAPQGAGMAALVAQYIRENNLQEKTGLSARQLSQSLLMSTAIPVKEEANNGAYYSILKQGSGLANVGAAVESGSYILMGEDATASAADGKVKAELGDDPDRTGVYSFSFTVHDLTGQDRSFSLSAGFFTQALFTEEGVTYLDKLTTPLDATVTWQVNGKALTPDASLAELDFDGDGDVDASDGQALLDYATGVRTELSNADKADLDGNGDIDSYDSYLFFSRFNAGALTVPANGSTEVTVTVSLTEAQKAALNESYENGAYVEGYVFVEAMTTGEGLMGESHSIPVLGFYGNWSDASMFDVGTYQEYQTGKETRTPYMGDETANTLGILYADDPSYIYSFGGNPIAEDAYYMPERNSINSENGDKISKAYYALIRNAAASRFTITNIDTDEVLRNLEFGAVYSAYFYSSTGSWQNTADSKKVNWTPSGLEEGTHLSLALTMAPEYYVAEDGTVDWDALGRGATMEVPVVIDNTAPTVDDVALSIVDNAITVIASDNQYIAGVALYDQTGTRLLAYANSKTDIQPGETAVYQVPLDEVYGTKFILQVADYAMNAVTYSLNMTLGTPQPLPYCIAFNLDTKYWVGFSPETPADREEWMYDPTVIWSATLVDKMLFTVDRYGELRIRNTDEPYESRLVGNVGAVITDMAYNKADGQIYGIVDRKPVAKPDGVPDSSTSSTLVRIDKYTAELEEVGTIAVSTHTLACAPDGTFYCNRYNSGEVYTFTLDTMEQPQLLTNVDGVKSAYIQAMEYDFNRDMLYWCTFGYSGLYSKTYLVQIDPGTGVYAMSDRILNQLACLVIPEEDAVNGEWANPTDQVSKMLISHENYSLLRGASESLSVDVLPWNVSDHSVVWTSSDPGIVTVSDSGVITGVDVGEAVVTVRSVVDPEASASCTVVVNAVETTLYGALQDANGTPKLFSWNLADDDNWTAGVELDTEFVSTTYDSKRDLLYAMDRDWTIHGIDMTTGETQELLTENTFDAPLWDMAYSNYWSTEDSPKIYGVYEGNLLLAADLENLGEDVHDMSTTLYERCGAEALVAVAAAGYARYNGKDTELFYLLDDTGTIWRMYSYDKGGSMDAYFAYCASNLRELGFYPDTVLDYLYCSMVVGEDGSLYVSYYNGSTNVIFHLSYNAASRTYFASCLDDVGDDVWPASVYAAQSNQGAETPAAGAVYDDTAEILSEALQPAQTTSFQGVGGGLNSVAYVAPASTVDGTDAENVTVCITAKDASGQDIASTNGVSQIRYDEAALTLKSVQVNGDYESMKKENGSVIFGYVSLDEVPAGATVATLTFEVKDPKAALVTVEHRQSGNETFEYEEVLDLHEHIHTEVRDAKAATCTEDGYTGDIYCTDCGKLVAKGEVIPANCPSKVFSDVDQSKWYHEAIDYVVSKNLMYGVSADQFSPNGDMSRAQLVTVLYRLAGSPEVTGSVPFTDVQTGRYYTDALVWAYEAGIAKGVTNDLFAPNASVTREQMVTFFARYAKISGENVVPKGSLEGYADGGKVSAYAVESMAWAVETGLIKGMGNNTLSPKGNATRAQVAVVLMRYDSMFE